MCPDPSARRRLLTKGGISIGGAREMKVEYANSTFWMQKGETACGFWARKFWKDRTRDLCKAGAKVFPPRRHQHLSHKKQSTINWQRRWATRDEKAGHFITCTLHQLQTLNRQSKNNSCISWESELSHLIFHLRCRLTKIKPSENVQAGYGIWLWVRCAPRVSDWSRSRLERGQMGTIEGRRTYALTGRGWVVDACDGRRCGGGFGGRGGGGRGRGGGAARAPGGRRSPQNEQRRHQLLRCGGHLGALILRTLGPPLLPSFQRAPSACSRSIPRPPPPPLRGCPFAAWYAPPRVPPRTTERTTRQNCTKIHSRTFDVARLVYRISRDLSFGQLLQD